MGVLDDIDEELWVYSELNISDVLKEDDFEKQMEIVKNWLKRDIENILEAEDA
jgi:hypothetical protein